MIKISNINKKYGESTVLDNVSTEIKEGCITAFIGPNGAGKSTLLGIVSRILKADSGVIEIDGKKLEQYETKELAKKIAVLKQQNQIFVRLTIRELVAFGRYPHSKGKLNDEDNRQIDEAIQYMNLEKMQHKYLDNLSGGEKQRAFIAMVIAQDTEYIFLDEPLNNLDMKHSVEIMQILQKLCQEKKKTVVIVIHDINFASCYSDYILAIKDNQVYINDTKDHVITPEVLEEVYDMKFQVCEINGEKICVYYAGIN